MKLIGLKTLSLALFLFLSPFVWAQESRVYDNLSLSSKILKKEKKFSIYLPPGYESSQRHYPVVYLLHGASGDHTDWIQFGNMQQLVDQGVKEGKVGPMIIVMPAAETTYYMNNANKEYQFEDFFIKELIPYVEKNYRCKNQKQFRALAGLSMGGFGSLLYALHHPDMFAACSAMSAAVRTDEEVNELPHPDYLRRYSTAMGILKEGDNRITDFWNQNSILYLVKNIDPEKIKAVRFYIDCGDDDHLYKGNSTLHILMRDFDIPHEYKVRNGGHTWEYWRTGLLDALQFINKSFQR